MLVIGFPTRFEAAGLVRELQGVKKDVAGECSYVQGRLGETQIIIAVLGMGPIHSSRCARWLMKHFAPKVFILTGFAGGLVKELKKGQVFLVPNGCTETVLEKLGEVKGMDTAHAGFTSVPITSAEEKRRLAEASGCQLIDMETAEVLAVARESGVKMLTVRVVSDLVDENLPAALAKGYDFETAKETPWQLFLYLLLHPHQLAPFLRFLKALFPVREKLTQRLLRVVQEAGLALTSESCKEELK